MVGFFVVCLSQPPEGSAKKRCTHFSESAVGHVEIGPPIPLPVLDTLTAEPLPLSP